ncbi:hypothetical protein CP533_6053 [Ophiocordyceps camponoti-saundersi (nom. inval.)]|nr:hypothetical protein CP533_6053 [Ophiocordyceps camponoti-saundersi (nom. inval.)]
MRYDAILAALLAVAHTAFATEASKSIKKANSYIWKEEYDFIIVGGGTSGLVLADRLTENSEQRVLVLEAGLHPDVVALNEMPGAVSLLRGNLFDWNFVTAPQTYMNGRQISYHRGRGLGGSSIINGLFYGRGSASVYDHWVKLGNPGWSWHDVLPSFIRGTHFNPPREYLLNKTYQGHDPSAYGDGPLQIGYQGYVTPSIGAFIEACEAVDVPLVEELNAGVNVGVKLGTGSITADYRRSSSYEYYKRAAKRKNLTVKPNSPVVRVTLKKIDEKREAVADGVIFVDHSIGREYVVKATKEVILTLGTFQSPQLLMLSGIGPNATLANQHIDPVVINENVGQNMKDHSVFSIMASVKPEASVHQLFNNITNVMDYQEEYYRSGTGPFTAPGGMTNGFQALSDEKLESMGAGAVVEAGLTNRSSVEFLFEAFFYPIRPTTTFQPDSNGSYISISVSNLVALSSGSVTLQSDSMFDGPIINPNYLAHPADRIVALNGFRDARKILSHPAFSDFLVGPDHGEVSPGPTVKSDDDEAIFSYVKAMTVPNWHATGTNRMLPLEDGGVVDARMRVYGVKGLRVCDSSIMPTIPDVNIAGPVYMLGEHGAKMIREDWEF